jgi:hypothetical protein
MNIKLMRHPLISSGQFLFKFFLQGSLSFKLLFPYFLISLFKKKIFPQNCPNIIPLSLDSLSYLISVPLKITLPWLVGSISAIKDSQSQA